MASQTVVCFLEDLMQEGLVTALVRRAAHDAGIHERALTVDTRNARGGIPAALAGLAAYVADVLAGREPIASIVVIAIDSDCDVEERRTQIIDTIRPIAEQTCVVLAVPDPYVERWYLLDLSALKAALGAGPTGAFPVTCAKGFYKKALNDAVTAAGFTARLGGYEYADLIVEHMDLYQCSKAEPQLGRFLADLKDCLSAVLRPIPTS